MSFQLPERPPDAEGQAPALDHVRALDGVRALGVMLVFLFHLNVMGFAAGFVGVDVFFVLSGFLITSLLLAEMNKTGKIKLSAFWARRARRLLPALVLVLVVVALVTMETATFSERASMRGDLVSTTLYVANWHFIHTASYFNNTGVTSPLQHTWSLSIEEQFYVLWPLLLVLLVPLLGMARRAVAVPALIGALVSAILLAVLYVPGASDRAYMGTDARIFEPLLGALAAVVIAGKWGRSFAEKRGTPLVFLGTGGLIALLFAIRPGTPFYYEGGAELISLATVLLVAPLWVGRGGPVKRLLEWGPVAWIGLVSYGLYLWHFPFVVWLHIGDHTGMDAEVRKLIAVAATFAAATASFYLIERPIRTARGWGLRWPQRQLRLSFLRRPLIALALVPVVMVSVIGVSVASTEVPPPSRSTPVVMLVGDSVPARLEPVFEQLTGPKGWRTVSAAKGSCSVTGELAWLQGAPGCRDVPADQDAMVRTDHPDVVVWWDRWSLSSFVGPGGKMVRSGSPLFWKLRSERLRKAVKRLTIGGAHVLFVATEPPGSALEPNCPVWCQTWRRFLVEHYRDIGRHWNAILERYARAHPNRTSFISITNLVCHDDAVPCDDRVQGKPARYDGTHYTDQTAPIVVGAIVNELAAIIAARRY